MKNWMRECRGSVLMETVLVMPVLLMLVFAIIQFAHIWTARQMVAYAAFCATRAVMVVPPNEQRNSAQNAAEIALSWVNLCDDGRGREVTIPGWGKVLGSGYTKEPYWNSKRVKVEVVSNGLSEPVATVKVRFRFPLVIPGMVVNKLIGERNGGGERAFIDGDRVDFYGELGQAAANVAIIDGWPYLELAETCTLPMPYSTANFPTGAFANIDIRK